MLKYYMEISEKKLQISFVTNPKLLNPKPLNMFVTLEATR